MKHILTSKWIKPAAMALLALVIGFSAVGIATGPAFAQAGSGTAQPNSANPKRVAALEKAFTQENTWLATQANNLQKIDQLATKAQALIDKAKGKGWNVGLLQAALDGFKAQIVDVQKSHDAAAATLSSHAGFDTTGAVTDVTVATQTVKDARQSLMDGRLLLRQSVIDVRTAIRNFRNEHKNSAPSAAPTTAPSGSGS